jgi:hypothetical protein
LILKREFRFEPLRSSGGVSYVSWLEARLSEMALVFAGLKNHEGDERAFGQVMGLRGISWLNSNYSAFIVW